MVDEHNTVNKHKRKFKKKDMLVLLALMFALILLVTTSGMFISQVGTCLFHWCYAYPTSANRLK